MPSNLKTCRANLRRGFFLCVLTAALSFVFAGCSKSTGNSLQVKSSATGEKNFAIKSGYAFPVTKTFTDATGKITTAAIYKTYVASYDLDAGNFSMTLDKPLTGDDQLRIVLSLVGEEGGNEKTPPKTGTYSAKADKFMKVEDVLIVSRKGGGENKFWLDRSTLSGEVKVTSASATAISGDINLSAGDNTIKGSFAVKVLARK